MGTNDFPYPQQAGAPWLWDHKRSSTLFPPLFHRQFNPRERATEAPATRAGNTDSPPPLPSTRGVEPAETHVVGDMESRQAERGRFGSFRPMTVRPKLPGKDGRQSIFGFVPKSFVPKYTPSLDVRHVLRNAFFVRGIRRNAVAWQTHSSTTDWYPLTLGLPIARTKVPGTIGSYRWTLCCQGGHAGFAHRLPLFMR